MTTAAGARTRTVSEALIPYRGLWVDVAIVIVGSLLIAAAAQARFTLPWTPVPVTGQTFAVLLVGASAGSRNGGLAAALYLVEGSAGLPFFAGGGSGVVWSLASGGYIAGFIPAAFLVGFLAERGWDRGPWLVAALLAANVLIYIPGLWQLSSELGTGFDRTLELGLWPFIAGDLAKIVLVATALPAAWSLIDMLDRRAARTPRSGDRTRDDNP